jgi:hypothetical protein
MTVFYLSITTNLLKRRGVVGRIATNLTNHCHVLGFNIHQSTSVTKIEIRHRIAMNFTNRCDVFGFYIHQYTSVMKNRNTL